MRISDWSYDVCSSDLDVGAARLEAAVFAFAVADGAAVEAEDRMARRGDPLRQHRHAAVRAAADLVSARHDQQPGRPRRLVERRVECRPLAGEGQIMPPDPPPAAESAAIPSPPPDSSPGLSRRPPGVPARPAPPRPTPHPGPTAA